MAELFQVLTEGIFHPLAEKTLAADRGGLHHHSVAHTEALYRCPFIDDDSRELMSEDQRKTDQGMLSLIGLDIRTADGCLHFHL
jgi:hypothetical protein